MPKPIRMTEREASIVLSLACEIGGCPLCYAFGRDVARRMGCEELARASGFFKRTPDSLAAAIVVHDPVEAEAKRRARLRVEGLCASCGRNEAPPGSACGDCRASALLRYRAKRAAGASRAKVRP